MKHSGNKWVNLHFEPGEATHSIPSKKPSKPTQNLVFPVSKRPSFNFHRKLTPKLPTDLAVHPKKIEEVNSWLKNNVCDKSQNTQTAKFLLVTGPTGSGKTITVQVLCKYLGINVSEWTNPVDQDFEVFWSSSQVTRFTDFLTESKWNSLLSEGSKKIILVEDFPNVFIRNPEEFDAVLENCYYKGNYPIVFICTNSADTRKNLSDKLFTQDIRNKYKIPEISFNACANTLLKNALKRAHNLVQDNCDIFKTPSLTTVNAIIATSLGDLKCAINQYYFASLIGTSELPAVTLPKKTGNKRKRNDLTSSPSSIQAMSKDQNLGLFHGLGRVLNPKRTETGKLQCDFDKLIDEFSTQPGIFTGFLFENYLKYFGDIKDVDNAAEILSLSQSFLEKWVDGHDVLVFALWVSTLGLMLSNGHRVSKWTQISGPKKIQKKKNISAAGGNVPVTDLYYYNLINKVENKCFLLT